MEETLSTKSNEMEEMKNKLKYVDDMHVHVFCYCIFLWHMIYSFIVILMWRRKD